MRLPIHFPYQDLKNRFSKHCIIELSKNIEKSAQLTVNQEDINIYSVSSLKSTNNYVKIEQNNLSCSCRQNILFGYPCKHIMAVLIKLQIPYDISIIIHKHWIEEDNNKERNNIIEYPEILSDQTPAEISLIQVNLMI